MKAAIRAIARDCVPESHGSDIVEVRPWYRERGCSITAEGSYEGTSEVTLDDKQLVDVDFGQECKIL